MSREFNVGQTGPNGERQDTLVQFGAQGATGRDSGGQLWVYVQRPSEGYASQSPWNMSNWWFGSGNRGTVTGHEFGHALEYMMQRIVGQRPNAAATNNGALDLENRVRRVQKGPNAATRVQH